MLQFLFFALWTTLTIQVLSLLSMAHFRGGPYDKEKWSKHWFKKLTLLYWKALAIRKRGKLVVLIDYENNVYLSIARPCTNGDNVLKSYVYFINKISPIELHENGAVTREFDRYYIHNWLPFDTEERTFMVLQTDARNFDLIFIQ